VTASIPPTVWYKATNGEEYDVQSPPNGVTVKVDPGVTVAPGLTESM
jgi:hypothetical protein